MKGYVIRRSYDVNEQVTFRREFPSNRSGIHPPIGVDYQIEVYGL